MAGLFVDGKNALSTMQIASRMADRADRLELGNVVQNRRIRRGMGLVASDGLTSGAASVVHCRAGGYQGP